MEPTEAELMVYFAGLEDEPILHAARERLTLTERAQQALEDEVRRRGLSLPNAQPDPAPPAVEMEPERWITLERFRDLSAAIVARSALEAADIDCFLRDENTVRMDWQVSNFIGGMRLQVLEQDREAAEDVLTGLMLEEDQTGDCDEEAAQDLDKCPSCGSTNVTRERKWRGISLASLLLVSLPLPRGKKVWTCSRCGTRWEDQN